jgi:hypothetical protein
MTPDRHGMPDRPGRHGTLDVPGTSDPRRTGTRTDPRLGGDPRPGYARHLPAAPPGAAGAVPPMVASRETERLASRLAGHLEAPHGPHRRKAIPADLAPSEPERGLLTRRARELDGALVPADPDILKRAVAALKAAGFATAGGEDSARLTIGLYVRALEGLPEWAVSEACTLVLRGEAGIDPAYAPSAPQLAALCRRLVGPVRVERARLAAILDAEVYPVPSAAEREAMIAAFARLLGEVTAAAAPARAGPDAGPCPPGPGAPPPGPGVSPG